MHTQILERSLNRLAQALLAATLLLSPASPLFGQAALGLSSATAAADGSATLNLSLSSPAGSEPAGVQWTLAYAPSDIISISAVAGPSATAAGKSLNCSLTSGAYACLLAGMNTTPMQNGVVAVVSVTIASGIAGAPISVTNALGVSPGGNSTPVNGAGGSITPLPPSPITVSGLTCNPNSLGSGANSTCTVTVSRTGGATVTLSDNAALLTTPASVTVGAGSTTATFTASAGTIATDQTATVTAT
ncbi:MAG: hypothetical protein LAQ30_28375, partial [Acidobacteriia bacterium]|nr:hypothetical protein [Terriglobia bacterium]